MCAKRRQFEREHAEDLRISAIFIKYTVGSFNRESLQSLNRDDVAICIESLRAATESGAVRNPY
jgi:hypothetical protein